MPLKIINNFTGRLTRQNIGDMNSGLAKNDTTFGADPFSNPSNLTWLENPVAINNPDGSANAELCIAARPRLESGVTYVYAVFDQAIVSKIQVNDPTSHNPDYDTATHLALLSSGSPTFVYGSSIQFYGATEKLFIGHDKGVTKLTFAGSGETLLNTNIVADVPRPSANFLGKLYFGNGNNILEIDSTETITTATKLSPAFPSGTYVTDLDVTPDGNYLQITVSKINLPVLFASQDTSSPSSAESYKFLWNGTDAGYTSYETYTGYTLTANTVFGQFNYTLGYDLGGTALYDHAKKLLSLPKAISPSFGSTFSTGSLFGFAIKEYVTAATNLQSSVMVYGQYDQEIPVGLFRLLQKAAVTGTDVNCMPMCITVTNLLYGSSNAGYTNNLVSTAKIYFSVREIAANGSLSYKFYKFTTVPTGSGTAIAGVYETQQETSFKLFRSIVSKKFKISTVRFYTEPLVTNNSFKVDLIGSDGNPMNGGTETFTVGTNVTAGQDLVQFTPAHAPTYSVGVRITNLGTANWTGVKMELEYEEAGVK